MNTDTLVFYDFFTQLRKQTDLQLDMDQYTLFLELFARGYAWGDKEQLRRLCSTLWLARPQYRDIFDREFDRAFEKWIATTPAPQPEIPAKANKKPETTENQTELTTPQGKKEPEQPPPAPPPVSPPSTPESSRMAAVYLELSDVDAEEEQGQAGNADGGSILEHAFILTNHFLPVKERRLQQNWRYLRFKAEKKPGTEIDIGATVERVAREGGFIDFEYEPRIEYKRVFHFLIDHEGSMVAFEAMAQQIVNAFRSSLVNTQVHTWYFHNYPGEVLFENPFHTAAIDTASWRARLRKNPAALFIISDAGAARGGEQFERILATYDWLEATRRYAPQTLWLNPVPRSRWPGSSAVYIASFIPMVDISKSGIAMLPELLKRL